MPLQLSTRLLDQTTTERLLTKQSPISCIVPGQPLQELTCSLRTGQRRPPALPLRLRAVGYCVLARGLAFVSFPAPLPCPFAGAPNDLTPCSPALPFPTVSASDAVGRCKVPPGSQADDVVSAIDVQHFAGDAGG